MMDSNGFYYTLSTISQTLAGAFGFLVAVVLYRMQAIKEELPQLKTKSSEARDNYFRTPTCPMGANESMERVDERLKQAKEKWDKAEKKVKYEEEKLETIKKDISCSLILTAVTLGECLFALPWGNFLTTHGMLVYYVACCGLLVVIGLAIYCLWTYYQIAKGLTK